MSADGAADLQQRSTTAASAASAAVHEEAVHLALKASVLAEDDRALPLAVDRIGRVLRDGERTYQKQDAVWVRIPRRLKFRGGRAWLSGESPKRGRMGQPLVKSVKRAHELCGAHADANRVLLQSPPTVHERGLIRLARLAPDLQLAMLEGRQKTGLCLEDLRFAPIPLCWDDQRRMLGA